MHYHYKMQKDNGPIAKRLLVASKLQNASGDYRTPTPQLINEQHCKEECDERPYNGNHIARPNTLQPLSILLTAYTI